MSEHEGGAAEGGLPANPAMNTPSANEPEPSVSPESDLGGGTSEAGIGGGRGDLGGGGDLGDDLGGIDDPANRP